MRRTALAVILGLALLGAGGVGAVAVASPTEVLEASQSVTLTLVRFYSNACNCYNAKASGQTSSGAAGEEVVILKQFCGRSFGTAVAAAQTREDGFFETEVGFVNWEGGPTSQIYRARWNGHLSAPVTYRGRLSVTSTRLRDGRRQVVVSTLNVNPVNLKRRAVVLQRQTGDDWTRVASARLAAHPVKYYTFVATFSAPRRGWTLRALVPARSAAPCFTASASEKWTS